VSSTLDCLAWRPPCGPRELTSSTLPPASRRRARHRDVTRELHAVTAPRARPTHAGRFHAAGRFSAEAQPAFQPATHSMPPCPVGCSLGWIGPDTVRIIKNLFSDLFNPRNISKFPKFIETCRNVQKSQTKFYWTPLGQIYTVGLTKFIIVQYFIVQNYMNSNTKINVCKYLYLQIF
jgi:hypothetical protein